MMNLLKKCIQSISTVLLLLLFATSVHAKDKVHWEILIDGEAENAFYANNGNQGISTDLFGPFVSGATYWLKGNLYKAGSVNESDYSVDESKKIGEWYCTGTRVASLNLLDPQPEDFGKLIEEANFTFKLNDGRVIYTKHHSIFGEPTESIVIFSDVDTVKPGDRIVTGNLLISPPRYYLVQDVMKK